MVLGSKFVTKIAKTPAKELGSLNVSAIPETTCLGFSSPKSTVSLKSLSALATFSAYKIFPTLISILEKSS
jgi:hypothetical protein